MITSRQLLLLFLAMTTPVFPARAQSSAAIQPEAAQILSLANEARAQDGAAPLQWDAALAAAARQHCQLMAANRSISHQYPGEPDASERAHQADAHFSLIEENVALAPTPAAIHNAWMNSPHHRSNLLNPDVDHVGIAVIAGRDGLYVVADYERIVVVLSQSQVESKIAALVKTSGIALQSDATLARAACATDDGMPRAASGPQPHYVMRWQTAALTQLPQELTDKLVSGRYRKAAVANCPTQGEEGSFTAYRLAVLLY